MVDHASESKPSEAMNEFEGIEIHPAANIFPLMSEADLSALCEDVKAHGQREPVVFWNGTLLDGRNRWRACKRVGVKPLRSEVEGDDFDPVAYVLSANLHRRHLDTSQRAMVAAKVKPLYEAAARQRQSAAGGDRKSEAAREQKSLTAKVPEAIPPEKTREKRESAAAAGAALNVGRKSVERAERVIEKGAPELVAAVERGEVSVAKAAVVAETVPKPQQLAKATEAKPEAPKPAASDPTATDILTALSPVIPKLRKVKENLNGEPFDAKAAGQHAAEIVGLLNGDPPAYKLVSAKEAAAMATAGGVKAADVTMPPALDNPEGRKALAEWIEHRRKRKPAYKTVAQVEKTLERCKGWTLAEFIDAVDHSHASGYQALVLPKSAPKTNGKPPGPTAVINDYLAKYGDRQ